MTAFASREHRLVVLCALADACTGLAHAGVQSDRGERLADLVLAWAEGKRPRLDEGTDEVLRELYEAILALDAEAATSGDQQLLEALADAADLVLGPRPDRGQP